MHRAGWVTVESGRIVVDERLLYGRQARLIFAWHNHPLNTSVGGGWTA
jgi:hypothetical protein